MRTPISEVSFTTEYVIGKAAVEEADQKRPTLYLAHAPRYCKIRCIQGTEVGHLLLPKLLERLCGRPD